MNELERKIEQLEKYIEVKEQECNELQEVLDKIKERHWKTRRNYVEDLTKLYDKLSEILEETK